MKKVWSVLLVCALCLGLCACGDSPTPSDAQNSSAPVTGSGTSSPTDYSNQGGTIPTATPDDLSDFGFDNTYGHSKWMIIDGYNEIFDYAYIDGDYEKCYGKSEFFYSYKRNSYSDYQHGYKEICEQVQSDDSRLLILKTTSGSKDFETWYTPVTLIDWERSPKYDSMNDITRFYFIQ